MSFGPRLSAVLKIAAAVAATLLVVSLGCALYLYNLSQSLPDLAVDSEALGSAETSIVYAADGSVLAEWHGEQDRTVVSYRDMPRYLRDAVVAVEDRRFWEHSGVDTEGIVRALRANAEAGDVRQGGSTITQQLVKILFTKGERTFTRKIREALLAYELEARAEKSEVLETYLNTIYFGNGAYGVESAAKRYFGKRTSSLTLAESATLAGLIRSPSAYDPTNDPEASRARRDLVLDLMREQGYITGDELLDAKMDPVGVVAHRETSKLAPHFVEYVKQELVQRLGSERVFGGGLRVHTTLEPIAQKHAEKSAKLLSRKDDPEVAIVAIGYRDGSVLAMVGGRDFRANQFNLAVQGRRQPGSAFKPFVLVTALERGVRPQQVFNATPYAVKVKDGVWNVQNYENAKTQPRMTLQAATSWSVNAVYARLIMQVGADAVVDTAKRMGITTPLNADPAIALGGLSSGVSPLEMASAYGTMANGGLHVRPTGIEKVTDADGAVVWEPDRAATRTIERGAAVQAALMLHDVVEKGTGTDAKIGTWAAGKTGTTQSYRDAWFVGWAGDITTAVWVGYPDAQVDMVDVHGIQVTGGSYPAKIWSRFMKRVTDARSKPITPNDAGGGQVLVTVCPESMKLANARCPAAVEIYLAASLVPQSTCGLH